MIRWRLWQLNIFPRDILREPDFQLIGFDDYNKDGSPSDFFDSESIFFGSRENWIISKILGMMSVTRIREGDVHLLQARVRENDFAVHDATVARELSKLMLFPRDVEEQKGHSLNDMMIGVYLDITRVSTSRLCSSQCTGIE